ncbi:MAG TPA: hypothetical protein VGD86_03160 [Devosia sp.]|jgi:hypothetical protein
MTKTVIREFHRTFKALAAAARAANAVEEQRRPQARDLQTLGIDPGAFDSVR